MKELETASGHRRSLWSLGGRSPVQIGFEAYRGYRQNRLGGQCAQFAYYSLLAMAPMLILVVASVSLLPVEGVLETVRAALDRGMPEEVVQLLVTQVHDIRARSSTGLVVGSLFLLGFAGSRTIWCIGKGLDAAFEVQTKRRAWIRGGIALAVTVGLFFLMIVGMLLLVLFPLLMQFSSHLADFQRSQAILFFLLRWGTVACMMLITAAVIYWLLPSADVPWCWLSPGSVFATSGWIAVTVGFRYYVANFSRYNETYGALAGVVVLLTWLYLTGTVLLMGGQINAVIFRESRTDRPVR